MKTDSLFYKLFKKFPRFFFEVLGQVPSEAEAYQLTSVEIKQPTFCMDGLLKHPDNTLDLLIYFLEVQFQPKEDASIPIL